MYHRSHETAAPTTSTLAPAHRSVAPEPDAIHPSHPSPLSQASLHADGVPQPQVQAAALNRASGGQLARTGPALLQLQRQYGNRYVQRVVSHAREGGHSSLVQKGNQTGLPDGLKAGIENLSSLSLDDVQVHYNSSKPARLQALAYTQGTDIHVGPGQEKHLAHEAWHVVQQKQGRVQPTMQAKGVAINDEAALEKEADVMGRQAAQAGWTKSSTDSSRGPGTLQGKSSLTPFTPSPVIQRLPYAKNYTESETKKLLDRSEGRASPVNNQDGHPRQHVGKWEKAERFAEEQGRTKSVYKNTDQQNKAISSALNSGAGQAALAVLDANPGVATRQVIANVATDAADVLVVKAKKKQGAAAGNVKSWQYKSGSATSATVVVDSMGTNVQGDIHIQTAYPVMD